MNVVFCLSVTFIYICSRMKDKQCIISKDIFEKMKKEESFAKQTLQMKCFEGK